jgi:outer membrane protein assembly factor BamC
MMGRPRTTLRTSLRTVASCAGARRRRGRLALLALAGAALLAGCSTVENMLQPDRIDYKSAGKIPTLEVPPDLSALARDNRFQVPASGSVSASQMGQQTQTARPVSAGVAVNVDGMRMERIGTQRYLVVNRKPEELWNATRDFWQESGFLLYSENADAGTMETDWAENRAKIPQDALRNLLGRVVEGLYSTGERDKFRTRLERTAEGTEIYISHRGMVEVLQGNLRDSAVWTQRPSDPELEAEFLRRLMVRLGQKDEQAKQQVARTAQPTVAAPPPAKIVSTAGGGQAVELPESFDRAWRRVGVALDRSGFTVEDRDRSKGLYFVRYVDASETKKDPGFFARLFSGDPRIDPARYQVQVKAEGAVTLVSVAVASGSAGRGESQGKILALLADQLK